MKHQRPTTVEKKNTSFCSAFREKKRIVTYKTNGELLKVKCTGYPIDHVHVELFKV